MVVTKAISNKGFSGNSSVLPRPNFDVGGQESSPKSLTAYNLNRCVLFYKVKIGIDRKLNINFQTLWKIENHES